MESPEEREDALRFHRELWSRLPEKDREAVLDVILEAREAIQKRHPRTLEGLDAFGEAFSILVYAELTKELEEDE